MISKEQMARAELEFRTAAGEWRGHAASAERALQDCNYPHFTPRFRDPQEGKALADAYHEADYMAESRSWVTYLIRRDTAEPKSHIPSIGVGVPQSAICYFMDGNMWCAVHADFVNLQESPAGFGSTMDGALCELIKEDQKLVDQARAALALAEQDTP